MNLIANSPAITVVARVLLSGPNTVFVVVILCFGSDDVYTIKSENCENSKANFVFDWSTSCNNIKQQQLLPSRGPLCGLFHC